MSDVQSIGYAKLGRSLQLDLSRGDMAGNAEAVNVLFHLAERNPTITWYITGKNNGESSRPLPENVVNLWPPGVPKAPWLHGDGLYRCSFCKTAAETPTQWSLDCCDDARKVRSLEEYIQVMMVHIDAHVMHVGQHGVVHAPIPTAKSTWEEADLATPYAWARNYGHYLIEGFNKFCDARDGGKGRVVWLTADPRNFFKARDIKWPTGATRTEPVLSQYHYHRDAKHERYGDRRTPEELGFEAERIVHGQKWKTDHYYEYSGLELAMLPDDWDTWGKKGWSERDAVGVATTAAYIPDRRMRRSAIVSDWIFKHFPDAKVYGKWSDKSLADLPEGCEVIVNNPLAFPDLLASSRTTVSLPPTGTIANGMNWCVAKPMQCWAARTVCFFIPPVDAQGWVLPNTKQVDGSRRIDTNLWSMRDDWTDDEKLLAQWMRVSHPEEYAYRARLVAEDPELWSWMVTTQRKLLQKRWDEHMLENKIEKRLGLKHD